MGLPSLVRSHSRGSLRAGLGSRPGIKHVWEASLDSTLGSTWPRPQLSAPKLAPVGDVLRPPQLGPLTSAAGRTHNGPAPRPPLAPAPMGWAAAAAHASRQHASDTVPPQMA